MLCESIAALTDVIVCSVGSYNAKSTGDGNAPRAADEREALLKPLHDIAHLWFRYAPTDPLLLSQQIIALTAFGTAGYYRRDTALLGSVLEKLFVSHTYTSRGSDCIGCRIGGCWWRSEPRLSVFS